MSVQLLHSVFPRRKGGAAQPFEIFNLKSPFAVTKIFIYGGELAHSVLDNRNGCVLVPRSQLLIFFGVGVPSRFVCVEFYSFYLLELFCIKQVRAAVRRAHLLALFIFGNSSCRLLHISSEYKTENIPLCLNFVQVVQLIICFTSFKRPTAKFFVVGRFL